MQDDDRTPATREDLEQFKLLWRSDLEMFKRSLIGQFSTIDDRFKLMREDNTRILDVVVNIDKRLQREHKNHEVRIRRLEEAAL